MLMTRRTPKTRVRPAATMNRIEARVSPDMIKRRIVPISQVMMDMASLQAAAGLCALAQPPPRYPRCYCFALARMSGTSASGRHTWSPGI